ncbi:molybdopterin-binding protein [Sinanaerobacter chloroacetimidivorans]|uniref:Molybdopterin molybdenumtransferase n=1 Tax=Sinanaerobacter chloroacetimidivorans TaxID=2818044 RepID=A0A8J8B168_9FIRM|nr:molybdopterin-binding protein [Sinanaerobacter chloroacetimidivorans]MBR0597939.1 molybdopterin-binding protein [Sinanaerobacter chloroacetimidivorans]
MKEVSVQDAVGMVLAHDLTQIIPGEFKGSKFKKGHIIQSEDIEILLSMGKQHLYVVDKEETDVHEDEAAARIAEAAAGRGIRLVAPGEGKIELVAEYDGLLKINTAMLDQLIDQDEIMFASIHENQLVQAGQKVAGTRVIPLFVNESVVKGAERVCQNGSLIEVLPLKSLKIGLVTTGSEVYSGKIKDAFGPVLQKKFTALGSTVVKQLFADDDEQMIADCINQLIDEGVDMIGVTGGMSVDPDDKTPTGIRVAGGHIVTYGAPVLPGAMFMLAYIGNVPVVGLPGCVMYSRVSIFDLVVPRILAGEIPNRRDIKKLAHGGLCQNCEDCTYPRCGFGKSS